MGSTNTSVMSTSFPARIGMKAHVRVLAPERGDHRIDLAGLCCGIAPAQHGRLAGGTCLPPRKGRARRHRERGSAGSTRRRRRPFRKSRGWKLSLGIGGQLHSHERRAVPTRQAVVAGCVRLLAFPVGKAIGAHPTRSGRRRTRCRPVFTRTEPTRRSSVPRSAGSRLRRGRTGPTCMAGTKISVMRRADRDIGTLTISRNRSRLPADSKRTTSGYQKRNRAAGTPAPRDRCAEREVGPGLRGPGVAPETPK